LTTEDDSAAHDHERDAALAAFGLKLEAPAPGAGPAVPEFHLWPDNRLPFELWLAAQTCLRCGMHGPEGLDYAALRELVRTTRCARLPASPRRRADAWAAVRIIELAALAEWAAMRRESADRSRRQ
jgi:hypothetical protein